MPKSKLPDEKIQKLLIEVVMHFNEEDREVRERQIRKCRHLKLLWDNIFHTWYSEVAHDWRIFDNAYTEGEDNDQAFYDKPMNVFRAYIDTIIAALSINTPQAKCIPQDADSTLDIITARAGDKIGQMIGRHNQLPLLWLKALYTFYTEGTTFFYNYPREDESYGTFIEEQTKDEMETVFEVICPLCQQPTEVDKPTDNFQPENQPQTDLCPNCGEQVQFGEAQSRSFPVTKIVGKDTKAKSRTILEAYGGLYVKIANYAKKPQDTPYLIYSYETHYANAVEEYSHLHGKSELVEKLRNQQGSTGPDDPYTQWGRLNTLYRGEYPSYVLTIRKAWLRPAAFNILGDIKDVELLRKEYPRGVKVCMVNDEFGEAASENLDDYWTISENPLEDYLTHDPAGIPLVPGQDITNDIISLALQTIEASIGQTFADPGVLNFNAYRRTEALPGGVYEATPKSGKSLNDAFYQVKTAQLSEFVMTFFEVVQSLNQMVSGALPSLFGGNLEGSNTASEYSMSRAQAQQRIQNTWKIFTALWTNVQGKAIPMYINNMKADEQDVVVDDDGTFMNVFIRRAELEGKIGRIELEASENLPSTWGQVKDTITKMMESQNEQIMMWLNHPANLPILREAMGLTDFYIPGEDARNKQNDEIRELLAAVPIPAPTDEMGNPLIDEMSGLPAQATSSIQVDPIYDEHPIEFEMVRKWANSESGRQARINNPDGYENVLLHGREHWQEIQNQMMQQQAQAAAAEGVENPAKPTNDEPRKIDGESDVNAAV